MTNSSGLKECSTLYSIDLKKKISLSLIGTHLTAAAKESIIELKKPAWLNSRCK